MISRLLAALAVAISSAPALAQDYPARDIRSICNFAAGSDADILVRYYSDRLVGAQGNIATEYVARVTPSRWRR